MTTQIISDDVKTMDGITYRTIDLATEKQSLTLMVVSGRSSYVQVFVNNASHQAWRGMGKRFDSLDLAIANYKSSAVKAMLSYAL